MNVAAFSVQSVSSGSEAHRASRSRNDEVAKSKATSGVTLSGAAGMAGATGRRPPSGRGGAGAGVTGAALGVDSLAGEGSAGETEADRGARNATTRNTTHAPKSGGAQSHRSDVPRLIGFMGSARSNEHADLGRAPLQSRTAADTPENRVSSIVGVEFAAWSTVSRDGQERHSTEPRSARSPKVAPRAAHFSAFSTARHEACHFVVG